MNTIIKYLLVGLMLGANLTACGPYGPRRPATLTRTAEGGLATQTAQALVSSSTPATNQTATASSTPIPSSTPSYTPEPSSTPSNTPTPAPPVINIANVTTLTLLDTLPGFHEAVGIKFSPDGVISIQRREDGTLQQSRVAMNVSLAKYVGSDWYFASPSFSPDGSLYFSQTINNNGYALSVYQVREDMGLIPLGLNIVGYSLKGFSASFSADDTLLASMTLPQLIEPTLPPNLDECAPNCFLTFSFKSMSNEIFILPEMKRMTSLDISSIDIEYYRMVFSPDNQYLATINSGQMPDKYASIYVKVWQVDDGKLYRQLDAYPLTRVKGETPNLVFSPDGANLALIGGGKLQVWQWQENKLLWTSDGVYGGLAYSPDGSLLATGKLDGSIQLWESEQGNLLQTLDGHQHPVIAVAFSPEGNLLVTLDEYGVLKLWCIAP